MLSAELREWKRSDIYLTPTTCQSLCEIFYKHNLIFKKIVSFKTILNFQKSWTSTKKIVQVKKCSSTPRELFQISLTFPMMPTEAKGQNLGSSIILTCHICFISSDLEQILSLSSIFMTLKFLKVISQTFCRMPISLNFSNDFLRIIFQFYTLDWNNTESGCMLFTACHCWLLMSFCVITDNLILNTLYFLIVTGLYIPYKIKI